MDKYLITICARGGSKGIPGKNIKILNENPLIYYSIKIAENFKRKFPNTDILLSTESLEISNVVKSISNEVDASYERPANLAEDSTGKIETISDVYKYAQNKYNYKYSYIIDLDITSPLRNLEDLINALNLLKSSSEALNIFSVSPANRNPYFNMVEKLENSDFVKLSKQGNFLSRQSAPKVFDLNASFYIYKNQFFIENKTHPVTDKSLAYIVPHICFDIDHLIDFEFMAHLMKEDKLDFDLGL